MAKDGNDKSKAVAAKPDDNFVADDKITQVHDAVFRPDSFATLFCDAAKSQVKVKDTLKEIIRELLESDSKSRESMLGLIRLAMKEDWKTWIRTKGGIGLVGLWTLITTAFGAWIGNYFRTKDDPPAVQQQQQQPALQQGNRSS